jgi:RNA-directed DNA polymerase
MGEERRDSIVAPVHSNNSAEEDLEGAGKSIDISKREVWEAFKRIRANMGAAGIDGQTLESFEADLRGNLYKLWNRLRSGSYFPPPVKEVPIPKQNGGFRTLGIPSVSDRVAQSVIKARIERVLEPIFDTDSYGYRPNKSAHMAIDATMRRCWKYDWVVEFDIKAAFDTINHEYLMVLVRKHIRCRWSLLYIERWLKCGPADKLGKSTIRHCGIPQGGIVSPILMNLYMHYVFDRWIRKAHPGCAFARYADDAVIHCSNGKKAELVLEEVRQRLQRWRLEMHPDKSGVVYCKDSKRRGAWDRISFTFLGFTFRPRKVKWKQGLSTGFRPAASSQACHKMQAKIREWKIPRKVGCDLPGIARDINAMVRGWYAYYGVFGPGALNPICYLLNRQLAAWARRKYRKLEGHKRASAAFLKRIRAASPMLFAHWAFQERRRMIATMGAV